MGTCLICEKTGTEGRFCTRCGFDLTTDVVSNPTTCALPDSASAALRNAKQQWLALNSTYSVQKSQIIDGRIRTETQTRQQAFDPQAGAYALPGSQVVDSLFRTGEAPAGQTPPHRNPYGPGTDPTGSPNGSKASQTSYGAQKTQSAYNPQRSQAAYAYQAAPSYGSQTTQAPYDAQTAQAPYGYQTAQTSYNPHAGAYTAPGTAKQIPLHQTPYGAGPTGQAEQRVQQTPGQSAHPMQQQASSGRKGRGAFRTILGVLMVFLAVFCLVGVVSGEAGSDSAPVSFAMLFFASMAWLLFKKGKPKQ